MDATELRFMLLAQVSVGNTRHGYGMARHFEAAGAPVKMATLFRALKALVREGLLTVEVSTDTLAGAAKKNHAITEKGYIELANLSNTIDRRLQLLGRTLGQVRSLANWGRGLGAKG